MTNRTRALWVGGGALLASWMVSCAHMGPGDPVNGVNPDGSPAWISRGSGVFEEGGVRALYGVGVLQGVQSESLARRTVGSRARGEIAGLLHVYVAALVKDYQRSTREGAAGAGALVEEQDMMSAQQTITDITLRGAEIREYWRDPDDGTLYALAVLKADTVLGTVSQADLPPAVRERVRQNARRAFDELERQLRQRPAHASPGGTPEATDSPPAEAVPPIVEEGAAAPAAQANAGATRVALKISGREADTLQTCFAQRLIGKGYDLIEGSSDADVLVTGQVRFQSAGRVGGSEMVKATITARVRRFVPGKTMAALIETVEVGRPTAQQAQLSASTKLCEMVVPKMVQQIRRALGSE